ncbi:MAG: ABC transporter permease [Spirochaetia bacterium]
MKKILIALRNLNRQKKRTILLGGAIAFGILIVTVINGFTGSFVNNVGENFSQLLAGHIFIDGVEKEPGEEPVSVIRDDQPILETVNELDIPVKYLTRRSQFNGILIFQGETVSQNIVGLRWGDENYFIDRQLLLEGTVEEIINDRRSIVVSKDVAEALNVELNDRILVKLRTVKGQQNVGDFVIAGITYDPGLFGSISAYSHLDYVNSLLDIPESQYMTLGIFLEDLKYSNESGRAVYQALQEKLDMFPRQTESEEENAIEALMNAPEEEEWTGTRYRLFTINDVMDEVQQIVDILNQAGLIILLILLVIIMVGITNTFRMIMYERIKEIGTIRALGMQRSEVKILFLLEALFLSLAGVIIGFVFAGTAMFILSRIFWGFDSPIYLLLENGYMTFSLPLGQTLINIAVVMGLTLLAAFFPTRKASNMAPVDALRA